MESIADIIGVQKPIVSVPPSVGYAASVIISRLVDDVFITREAIDGLMADLLCVDSAPAGKTRLTDWAREHVDWLGQRYASELARRRERRTGSGDADGI